jgi:hypothetical protein
MIGARSLVDAAAEVERRATAGDATDEGRRALTARWEETESQLLAEAAADRAVSSPQVVD